MEDETYPTLSPIEARVLGCLLEKAATTPDAYPLTLNSLQLACNQKSNRQPVVDYDEDTIVEAIDDLRTKQLVFRVDVAGSRVAKYRHNFDELLGLHKAGKALMTVLLLRGSQTLGELRTRCERMYSFASSEAVEQELAEIAEEVDRPLWIKLPRAPGQKEERYHHLFCGTPDFDAPVAVVPSEPAMVKLAARDERIQNLENEVERLNNELGELKTAFDEFRTQFL
ncbi:MAG: YceH family protein [Opitutaceae bacterium]